MYLEFGYLYYIICICHLVIHIIYCTQLTNYGYHKKINFYVFVKELIFFLTNEKGILYK